MKIMQRTQSLKYGKEHMEEVIIKNEAQSETKNETQGSISASKLKNFVERVERLEEQKNNFLVLTLKLRIKIVFLSGSRCMKLRLLAYLRKISFYLHMILR